jgi:hypothetical protein
MKKFVLLGVIAGCLYFGVHLLSSSGGAGRPIIEYTPVITLEEQNLGEIVDARFQIRNLGDQPLEIDQLQTSCSCAGIVQVGSNTPLTGKRLTIPPKSEVDLAARITVRGVPGLNSQVQVGFHTNDPDSPQGMMLVEIPRILGVVCSPTNLNFSNALIGKSYTETVNVRSVGTQLPTILSVASSSPELFDVQLLPRDDKSPNKDLIGQIKVSLAAAKMGSHSGTISVTIQSEDGRNQIITLPVTADIEERVVVSPKTMTLPRASGSGAVMQFNCLVRSRDNTPITVQSFSLPDDFVAEIENPLVASTTKLVSVRWTPNRDRQPPERYPLTHKVEFLVIGDGKQSQISISVECQNPW